MSTRRDIIVHPAIIARFTDDYVGISKGNLIYHCPFCESLGKGEDTSGKLYVHNTKLIYQCWRCGSKGSVKGTVKDYDFEETITEPHQFEEMIDSIVHPKSRFDFKLEYAYDVPIVRPTPGTTYYDYLISRGITPPLMEYYQIKVGSRMSKYRNRLIIPNELVIGESSTLMTDMFVARSVDPNAERRYLNPYGENKSKSVFNLHRIPKGSPIIICEGVFTAMSAGTNAVATYGKFVSDIQLYRILRNNPSTIYVNLDSDARSEALELCERIKRMGFTGKLYITSMPDSQDASDLGHFKFMEYLVTATPYDKNLMKLCNILGGVI